LNLIGPQGVKIYNNFKKKEKTNFDTVVPAFNQYCEPRKNIIFQRYKFGCCIQQEGQSFDDFLTELKTLAATCSKTQQLKKNMKMLINYKNRHRVNIEKAQVK